MDKMLTIKTQLCYYNNAKVTFEIWFGELLKRSKRLPC